MIRTIRLRNLGSLVGVAVLLVLILYPLATLLVQIVFPNLFAVQISLKPELGPVFSALTDKLNVEAIVDSFTIGMGGALLASLAGIVTAFASTRATKGWKVFVEMSVWVVFLAPSYVIAQGWVVLMQDGGVFAQLFGLHNGWSAWFFTRFGLALVMGLKYFPFVHIAMVQAIQNLGSEFAMAGRLNGATPQRVFRKITLPLMTPAVLAGLSIAFAEGFGDFGFAAAITPETHIPLVTYQIYQALAEAPVDYSTAALMSFLLILVTGGGLWLQFWWTGRRSYVTVSAQSHAPERRKSSGTTVAATVIALLAVAFPVGGSVLVSLWRVWESGMVRGNWTLHHYVRALNLSSASMHALGTSLIYGLVAALSTGTIALFLGYQLTFKKSRMNHVVNLITMASLAIPGVVLAAGFIFAWNASWMHAIHIVVYGTPICLGMAYIAISIPYSIRLQYGAMSQLSPNLFAAAQLLGARQWRIVLTVVLPLVSSTAISTFFMTFTHTIFELPASMMLYPAGMPTFSVQTNVEFSAFKWAAGSALTMIGMAVVLASYILGRTLANGLERRFRAHDARTCAGVTEHGGETMLAAPVS